MLAQFVPLGLHCWGEQAVLDGEQLGVDVDGLNLKDACWQVELKEKKVSLPTYQHLTLATSS